jgi:signal transduction histidine kinase
MQRRLLVVFLAISALVVTGFAWPVLVTAAAERTQSFLISRTADLDRIAALAQQAVRDQDYTELLAEVWAYHQIYGDGLLVVASDGLPLVRAGLAQDDPGVAAAVAQALENQPTFLPEDLRPWSEEQVLLAAPIGVDTEVNGAVVLRVSVRAAAADIGTAWLRVLGAALAVAVVCVLLAMWLAMWLARWVLRPLHEIGRGVRAVAAGENTRIGDRLGPRELRALAASFNDMAAAITAGAEQQRRLVADASHELRNPIARLRLTVDSLVPYVTPDGRTAYGRIVVEVGELEALSTGLLALAAADHAATELLTGTGVTDSCDAMELLVERRETWFAAADRAGVRLSVPDSVRAVRLSLSELELKQVLDVAIDNAIKYAGPGAHVRLDCESGAGWGRVAIADDGPGLPDAELAVATTRFWRSRRHHGGKGSGLGLAIAERLVTARDGTFRLRANQPRGLVVELTVPLAKEAMP